MTDRCDWPTLLRDAHARLRLTTAQIARAEGLPYTTVRAAIKRYWGSPWPHRSTTQKEQQTDDRE